jgi:hypothetical protein
MSLCARVTWPLHGLDGPVNRATDLTVRVTPWMWWPASPPRRDRPLDGGQHAVYLAWATVGFLAGDLVAQRLPPELRSTGGQLRNERIVTGLLTAALWLVTAGAWDRRAERLRRRPWQRRRR